MSVELLIPTPAPKTVIGRDDALIFDVRSDEDLSLLAVGARFPRVVASELIYAGDPNTTTSFEGAYDIGSTITPISDPGFFRWRFSLRRKPGWFGNPDITIYSAEGIPGPQGPTGPTGPAGATGATGPIAAPDATYFVKTVHPDLTNELVADDSTEIDLDYTTPSVVSWFLKTASIVFAKLQNLTGLSVLGRASSSSGVMAAITGTERRQVLQVNSAGDALVFDDYEYETFGETVSGTLTNRALPTGMKSGDTLRWALTGNVTLNSFAVPYPGFWFNLVLGDSSGGDFTITIVDEHAGSTADNRIRTPGSTSPSGETEIDSPYLMSSEEEAVKLASGGVTPNTRWRIIAGTAAQAITGAVSVAGGNGGTRSSLFAGIRDNGTLETARGFINVLSSTSITASIAQDSSNDEQEWTWAVASGSITALRLAPASSSLGAMFFLGPIAFSATGAGADDVSIYSANAPFAFRIVKMIPIITTGAAGAMQARNATAGGGAAVSSEFDTTTASDDPTITTNNGLTATIAANGTLVIRRTNGNSVGEALFLCVRT